MFDRTFPPVTGRSLRVGVYVYVFLVLETPVVVTSDFFF